MMLNGRQLPTVMCTWHSVSSWDGSCNISCWCLMRMCHQQEMGQGRVVVQRRRSGSASSEVLNRCIFFTPVHLSSRVGFSRVFFFPGTKVAAPVPILVVRVSIILICRCRTPLPFSRYPIPTIDTVVTCIILLIIDRYTCLSILIAHIFRRSGPSPNGQDQGGNC